MISPTLILSWVHSIPFSFCFSCYDKPNFYTLYNTDHVILIMWCWSLDADYIMLIIWYYHIWENFSVGKIGELVERKPFTKFYLPNFYSKISSNCIMQLIHQYFGFQLVQISSLANVLPLQNFPTYIVIMW